jgi:ABC-2 type transport system permease protein
MPIWLRYVTQIISPTPHFAAFARVMLYHVADLSLV